MDFLEYLKQDPKCLYIYSWGPYIYGLSKELNNYIVIVTDDWNTDIKVFPDTWGFYCCQQDGLYYTFYKMKCWFDKVLLGDLDCWECACLNKKFIIKEHVKLMMHTNPLQLRKNVDTVLYKSDNSIQQASTYNLWNSIKACKYANQIIDNHKIINPKEANRDYQLLEDAEDKIYTYRKLIEVPYKNLKLKTDSILKADKIKKVLKAKKNG